MKKSTYFYRLAHLEMSEEELKLRRTIITIFHESFGYYGHRKIAMELEKQGTKVDKKTVAKNNEGRGSQVQVLAQEVSLLQ